MSVSAVDRFLVVYCQRQFPFVVLHAADGLASALSVQESNTVPKSLVSLAMS